MKMIPHIRFEDFEQRQFSLVASVSILCDKSVEDRRGKPVFPRYAVVHRAAEGDMLSPHGVAVLIESLERAIEDRGQVIKDMKDSGHPPLAEAAEQWVGPLRVCLALAEQAHGWVGDPEPDDDEGA